MLSGHLPAGSKLLVLAPDEKWKDMMRARNRTLFESWEVVDTMDVDTAKGAHLASPPPSPPTPPHLLHTCLLPPPYLLRRLICCRVGLSR